MFKHIMVPLDGSSFAEAAIPAAAYLAQKFEAKITLIHVMDMMPLKKFMANIIFGISWKRPPISIESLLFIFKKVLKLNAIFMKVKKAKSLM